MPNDPTTLRLLITAGPTQEPIDSVRYLGNRSSGKLGSSLASAAAASGWQVTLLLGPNAIEPEHDAVDVIRFRSTADLQTLLQQHLPEHDTLVMAAAVADYRPVADELCLKGKRRREPGELTIRLESTPDLLAGCASAARDDQLLIGFALEPRDRLESSAFSKLDRKNIDLIVANPLETMDASTIEARLIGNPARELEINESTPGRITKAEFAGWLLAHITPIAESRARSTSHSADARRPHGHA